MLHLAAMWSPVFPHGEREKVCLQPGLGPCTSTICVSDLAERGDCEKEEV